MCCYSNCDAPATCRVEGDGFTWSMLTTPLIPPGSDVPQSYEFCRKHGVAVAQERAQRKKPRKA